MQASENAINLIKKFEGCRLQSYNCQGGVCTIGYGHTRNVKIGDVITYQEATKLLLEDIKEVEKDIKRLVKVPLTQNQYDALVSFVFNVGCGNFGSSTLLKLLNENKLQKASMQFCKWIYVRGNVSKGLKKRREKETKLFNKKETGECSE